MSSDSTVSKSPVWDWPSWMKGSVANPLDIYAAPQNLMQPILPLTFGNVYNVTGQNSSSPDTERDIVAKHSYGRQLGHLMDAVTSLIAGLPEEKQKDFEDFLKLHREIDDLKCDAAARRLKRVASDLAALKKDKPEEYESVAAQLRDVLKATD